MSYTFRKHHSSFFKIKAYYKVAVIFLLSNLIWYTSSNCWAFSSCPPLSEINITNVDGEGCCFQLSYQYDGALGDINRLETRILTPNVLFSSVQFPLDNGWSYEDLLTQRRLRWSHNDGDIPLGGQDLANFCFSGWNTAEPVELLVIWRDGNAVRQRDTIQIECSQCWVAETPIVNCEVDSSYTYTFDFVNLSEFTVDYLQIRESSGQDLVIEQEIDLTESLAPGATAIGVQLHFRSETIQTEEICFEITPRHVVNDSIAIQCCTAEYCVPIPECDRCCTDYDTFVEDVERGFSIATNCDEMTVQLQAIGLSECDRVRFDVIGLGAGVVDGNETVLFGNLDEDAHYEVSMTVTRQNMDGEDCYEEASLTVFDDFVFDCDQCVNADNIDYDIICPAIPDFVCGCDNMTYLNACAASNWGGVSMWTTGGVCENAMLDSISCVTIFASDNATVHLEWELLSASIIRYFIIERRLTAGTWFNIGQVDGSVFNFTDNTPLNPVGEYRILGVSLGGKVLIGYPCPVGINELDIVQGGQLYPNPASQLIQIKLPVEQQQYFEIRNSTGQRFFQSQTNNLGEAQIVTHNWPSGYYYITTYIDQQTLWRKPFIIDH